MESHNTLSFALSDRIDDVPVEPTRVPLALLGEFQKEVADFLKGSAKEVDTGQTIISIEKGSLALVASGLLAATGLWADVAKLQNPAALGLIDPKRAAVVERWQKAARKNPNRRYLLMDEDKTVTVLVDSQTEFRNQVEAVWVPVEKYLSGLVTDLGGTTKANVHLKLADGQVLTIVADQHVLANEQVNRLYKLATLLVRAEESLSSGQLRNLALMSFQPESPGWDEAAFAELVQKGTHAWKDVPDDWLEELRSNQG